MEWIETRGKSVDEAKERALDMLGVTADEADFEVMGEAKTGLFGRVKEEARVRARVRPREPRPKTERRTRRRSGDRSKSGGGKGRGRSGGKSSGSRSGGQDKRRDSDGKPGKSGKSGGRGGERKKEAAAAGAGGAKKAKSGGKQPAGESKKSERGGARTPTSTKQSDNGDTDSAAATLDDEKHKEANVADDPINVTQQADMVDEFLTGLVGAFGVEAEISDEEIEGDDTIIVHVDGDDLGLLIGPKGNTLRAVEELSRTVVQRRADGPIEGRVKVDIGRYRARRQEALEAFVAKVASVVIESGVEKALEPMGAADRKIVHDAATEIDGVRTISEGEEPRRRVVLVPDS